MLSTDENPRRSGEEGEGSLSQSAYYLVCFPYGGHHEIKKTKSSNDYNQ